MNILYRYLETIGRLALGIGARGTIQPGALLAARGLQEQPMATFLMALSSANPLTGSREFAKVKCIEMLSDKPSTERNSPGSRN